MATVCWLWKHHSLPPVSPQFQSVCDPLVTGLGHPPKAAHTFANALNCPLGHMPSASCQGRAHRAWGKVRQIPGLQVMPLNLGFSHKGKLRPSPGV